MPDMLFECIGDRMVPVLPVDSHEIDGERFFTLTQAVDRTGLSPEDLTNEWLCYFPPGTEDCDVFSADPVPTPSANSIVGSAIDAARVKVLRVVRFPHLSDEHWRYVVQDCARRRLDPSLIWVKLEPNHLGIVTPVIITTIAAFRLIAERSGQRDGETSPMWCGPDGVWKDLWLDPNQHPYAAKVSVLKKGVAQPYEGIAYWKMHAQYQVEPTGLPVLERMWESGDAFMLAKCAAALAYREGWPEEFAGLYTRDEITPPQADRNRSQNAPARPLHSAVADAPATNVVQIPAMISFPDDPTFAWRFVDETTPESLGRLELELMEAGVAPKAKAQAAIGRFRQALPRLFDSHFKAFCAAVLKCVRENPAAYDLAGF